MNRFDAHLGAVELTKFSDIGKALGVSTNTAQRDYIRAMEKIKRLPEQELRVFREAVEHARQVREQEMELPEVVRRVL